MFVACDMLSTGHQGKSNPVSAAYAWRKPVAVHASDFVRSGVLVRVKHAIDPGAGYLVSRLKNVGSCVGY